MRCAVRCCDSFRVLYAVLLTSCVFASTFAVIDPSERAALEALFLATGGGNWTTNSSWLSETDDACTWYGVSCGGPTLNHVTYVQGFLHCSAVPSSVCGALCAHSRRHAASPSSLYHRRRVVVCLHQLTDSSRQQPGWHATRQYQRPVSAQVRVLP